ncbi:MAG: DJ-1/PfpI family protein [Bacteroidota bacterium]
MMHPKRQYSLLPIIRLQRCLICWPLIIFFNTTGQLNVYIVAKEKVPVQIKKDLFILPQLTFKEADSLKLTADVIVIPALSIRDEKQDPIVISFIQEHFTPATKLMAVCDGAATAAATGLFDGKPITCHASDLRYWNIIPSREKSMPAPC